MKIDGQCLCGAIAYEAEVDPEKCRVCHCSDCQALSGAPMRASITGRFEDFHLLRGTPRVYVKTADSGAKRAQAFCADCGSPIYAAAAENPEIVNIRLGSVRQRAEIVPKRQIWCSSALAWVETLKEIPGTAGQD